MTLGPLEIWHGIGWSVAWCWRTHVFGDKCIVRRLLAVFWVTCCHVEARRETRAGDWQKVPELFQPCWQTLALAWFLPEGALRVRTEHAKRDSRLKAHFRFDHRGSAYKKKYIRKFKFVLSLRTKHEEVAHWKQWKNIYASEKAVEGGGKWGLKGEFWSLRDSSSGILNKMTNCYIRKGNKIVQGADNVCLLQPKGNAPNLCQVVLL